MKMLFVLTRRDDRRDWDGRGVGIHPTNSKKQGSKPSSSKGLLGDNASTVYEEREWTEEIDPSCCTARRLGPFGCAASRPLWPD